MNSDKLLEDLESLVLNASKMPFTNKKMIEEEELLQIIDDLKASMPAELDESKKFWQKKIKLLLMPSAMRIVWSLRQKITLPN